MKLLNQRALALAACIAATPSLCNAQAALVQPQYRYVLPPVEYDRPYNGDVWILRADPEQMRRMCPPPKIVGNLILGCAKIKEGAIAEDDVIKKGGMSYRLVRRHEESHCVGWPNDHKGARLATEKDW
jgi:hypothetical protein